MERSYAVRLSEANTCDSVSSELSRNITTSYECGEKKAGRWSVLKDGVECLAYIGAFLHLRFHEAE